MRFPLQVTTAVKAQSTVPTPRLCFFQGGPGFESPAPNDHILWLSAAVKHFKVVLLDQRGTGLSTPVRSSTLAAVGDAAAQLAYLQHFRADSIVADAELLRQALTEGEEKTKWSIIGQSFGGFCCAQYLSKAPECARTSCPNDCRFSRDSALPSELSACRCRFWSPPVSRNSSMPAGVFKRMCTSPPLHTERVSVHSDGRRADLYEVFMTGGIPPGIDEACAAELVYRHTFQRVATQNEKFYRRFPGDNAIAKAIVNFLVAQPGGGVRTPSGSWLRPRTLQLLGMTCTPLRLAVCVVVLPAAVE
jgi:pimeloyl-ACP methyl ester carboxylesterase